MEGTHKTLPQNIMKNLSEYYQFCIEFVSDGFGSVVLLKGYGFPIKRLEKLTPSQWKKASVYLTRELVPFQGYTYKAKDISKVGIIRIK